MHKPFVTFYSPGTFVPEETTQPIDKWDVDKAVEMARSVIERHSAKPYAFRFTTQFRDFDELDSKVTERSNFYYLGGHIETKEEVFARNAPEERILRSNMKTNGIDKIIVNKNSWLFLGPFNEGDVLLNVKL